MLLGALIKENLDIKYKSKPLLSARDLSIFSRSINIKKEIFLLL